MSSELSIENQFIHILSEKENQWRFRSDLKTEDDLWSNFRNHLNRLNTAVLEGLSLTDTEFERVRVEFLRLTSSPFLASQWLRGENGVAQILLERESGEKISLEAFRNKDVAGGTSAYEVVHQIVPDTERSTRGDVTLLINGLPIIHIELKKESAKDGYMQAYHQIQRYAQDGFFDGIYATTQLFVVSNRVDTRYFARPSEDTDNAYQRMIKFLFNWRTEDNVPVPDLFDFARIVLKIPDAHELISQYTILVDDQKSQKFLMVLRPYQIHAIRKIKRQAALHEGGFIWHATGSGKTITSFVATKLLAQNAIGVDRTIMVVDRTDLDAQTQDEFTKFASEYHTGQTSGNSINNTLIVGIQNKKQLTRQLLSKKNNNTIMITTIQKLSAAMRSAQDESKQQNGHNQFDKLRQEHIVFIVDEAHRAVSDEEMRNIKKILPNSTWFGLTGTPIFEENQKQENGTYARTTEQQYGPLLHAYTTKNAMDDQAVLGFQVEYHALLPEGDQEEIIARFNHDQVPDELLAQERLLPTDIYETDQHIQAMLHKIFDRRSVIKKFKVQNGYPTMSGILTTHSIAQAKRIYHTLKEMKASGTLMTGRHFDERHQLIDPDFPRIAITFSTNPDQQDKNSTDDELLEIMSDYAKQFDSTIYTDEKSYNQNINKRLARKEKQYQSNGQWLDLVIVVDRLLTGFDAPTIQTLYVDREMKYQKLLQAFSRTNRIYAGKDAGMIVTFRKPETMKQNVQDTFRLFSNEKQNFEVLVPKEYAEVRTEFDNLVNQYFQAEITLEESPGHLPSMIAQVKAYQKLARNFKILKSYDDYEEEADALAPITSQLPSFQGKAENLKATIKDEIEGNDDDTIDLEQLLSDIVFSSTQNATHKEQVDSFYINQLLKAIQDKEAGAIEKFDQEIKRKDPLVQPMYQNLKEQLLQTSDNIDVIASKDTAIQAKIQAITEEQAQEFGLSLELLKSSINEYQADKQAIPYLSDLLAAMTLSKNEFESKTGEKYRKRIKIIEQSLLARFDLIQKWKEEL